MSRTALVTGGAGFIGSALVRQLLDTGWRVKVLDNLSTGRRDNVPKEVELLVGDICDDELCSQACSIVDTLFHLAARVTVRQSVTEFVPDAEVNLLGTLRLLRAAGAAKVRRFVLASSMAVYDDGLPGKLVSEDHPKRPRSPYGLSKLAAEQYLALMAPILGLQPVILRFFNTYGPRQSFTPYVGVLTIFVTQWLKGEPCAIFGDGAQQRDFVHVEDVARACALAADAPDAVGKIFNVGTGRGLTVNDLAATIQKELRGGVIEYAPAHPAELRYSVADISLAKRCLGYEPKHELARDLPEIIAGIRTRLEGAV